MRTPYALVLAQSANWSFLSCPPLVDIADSGDISQLSHVKSVQLPLSKRSQCRIPFYTAPLLLTSLQQHVRLSSSFSEFRIRIIHFYHGNKRNTWHLHGSNPSATSLRCMFRLGHRSHINIKSFRQCSCGSTVTLEHLLQCNISLQHANKYFTS